MNPIIFPPAQELQNLVNGFVYEKSNEKDSVNCFLSPSWSRTALIICIDNQVDIKDTEANVSYLCPACALKGVFRHPVFARYSSTNMEFIGADLSLEAIYVLTGLNGTTFINNYYDATLVWKDLPELLMSFKGKSAQDIKDVFESFILSKIDVNRLEETDLFREAVKTIKEYNFGLTLEELYKKIGTSKSAFYRLTNKLTGTSPKTIFSLMIFEELMKAHKENAEQLTRLADELFYDLSHINKWYKKYVNCSPTEFLKQEIDINNTILDIIN